MSIFSQKNNFYKFQENTQLGKEEYPINCHGGKCCNTNSTSTMYQATQMLERCY